MKFEIKGTNTSIIVDCGSYMYPAASDYWDGNWIGSNIKISVPGFKADFNASMRTNAISEFLNGLKAMHQNLKGTAALEPLEPSLKFKAIMNPTGSINWTARAQHPLGDSATLSFKFDADQTYLPKLIDELEQIVASMPVKSAP